MARKQRKLWHNLLLLGVVFLVCFLLFEVGARLLIQDANFLFTSDSIVGKKHIKNGDVFKRTSEFSAQLHTNNQGFADSDRVVAKPAQTYRIAVLGDSLTEAFQVNHEEKFTTKLEEELNTDTALLNSLGVQQIEVLNFGVSGYGTAQQYLQLKHKVAAYEPDLVLLAMFPSNDIQNNHPDLEVEPYRPFFKIDKKQQLVRSEKERKQSSMRKLMSHSWFLVWSYKKAMVALQEKGVKTGYPSYYDLYRTDLSQKQKGIYDDAWKVTLALIYATEQSAQEMGAEFGVIIIPNKARVSASYWQEVQKQYPDLQQYTFNLNQAEKRLNTFFEKQGYGHISLTKALQEKKSPNFFYYDGHLTAQGHTLTTDALTPWIKTEFLN